MLLNHYSNENSLLVDNFIIYLIINFMVINSHFFCDLKITLLDYFKSDSYSAVEELWCFCNVSG